MKCINFQFLFISLIFLCACNAGETRRNNPEALSKQEQQISVCISSNENNEHELRITDLGLSNDLWHFWHNGIIIDIGSNQARKYQQGLWQSSWLAPDFISQEKAEEDKLPWAKNRYLVWNEGSNASLRFPLPPLPQMHENTKQWVFTARLRPKVNRQVDIRLNSYGQIASIPLSGSWETIRFVVDREKLNFGGENTINFVFAGSYFEGDKRVAAKFDYLSLSPHDGVSKITKNSDAGDEAMLENYKFQQARILDITKPALGLVYGDTLSYYTVLPEASQLKLELGPGPWLQKEAKVAISIYTDEGMRYPVFENNLKAGQCWENISIELTQWANTAVRLEFSVLADENSPFAWKNTRPIAYFANPRLISMQKNNKIMEYASKIRDSAKNVILINIDGLRADRVLSQSSPPNPLKQLAMRGISGLALAGGMGSVISTVSLLYGVNPLQHSVLDTKTHVRNSLLSLAERFEAVGWKTAFYTNNPFIDPKLGYAQGFRVLRNLFEENFGTKSEKTLEIVADQIARSKDPTFTYVHLAELRLPLSATQEQLQRHGASPNYQGAINSASMQNLALLTQYNKEDAAQLTAYYDAKIENLSEAIDAFYQKIPENTLIILTASHGFSLGEDSLLGYNNSLSPAELLVPYTFVMKSLNEAYKIPELVQLDNVYATITQIFALDNENTTPTLLTHLAKAINPFAVSDTHRASASGPYFYLLRNGDNDTLTHWSWENMSSKQDLRKSAPIAHRAMRDKLFSQ